MSTTSTDKNAAIELMEKAVEVIGETVRKDKGDITIKMKVSFFQNILNSRLEDVNGTILQPKVVSETEDAELKALMEQFEAANMDQAGDDESSEEDE